MNMSFLVYLVLLFLSMHACTSRPLGVFDNQLYLHLSDKAVKLPMKEIFHAKNDEVVQEKPNFRELKSLARSTLESPTAARDTEESVKYKEDDPVEDVVVMDYAQPHRKTPIHNKAP